MSCAIGPWPDASVSLSTVGCSALQEVLEASPADRAPELAIIVFASRNPHPFSFGTLHSLELLNGGGEVDTRARADQRCGAGGFEGCCRIASDGANYWPSASEDGLNFARHSSTKDR